ncbi:glycosyltransferase family 2 protein [Anabaena sp. FACHB-709]|uniref:Glycosyltransferase family 2 protein n=2 Tax=Nostocaceae TaxID=1162 RepID=A0ABR7ZRF1_ANACY|nr:MULTISPECIES: glycosyltransferase family 2 protein [Nostocaceae]BAY70036.1 putative glucosyltransferase [Trichormus variabilis NIES-23]HBW32022.1 glycosyltransferase family 2 protein [Nostoc sp. UBA8866]MBD2174778.1 glycosyltransferase family 2 protein [Anabaena cylindrica FACHB-318]MBD2266539.1 glycosyltransferase family 2 protein [Anabaena sp. FACHB-709]MBD2276122.1 glycosyltransferase family 2 protein [Nostoc sp. PCC 7120 = FACHB-418]
MKQPTLAVIMTCHNRRNTTLACLQALYQQKNHFDVYLTDDGSTDGTAEFIKAEYPDVKIFQGDGNLFWVGGMHLAFGEAIKNQYDYYLWLNDDTFLEADALEKLLQVHENLAVEGYGQSIVVGSTQDPITKQATYGGAVKSKKWYSNKFEFLEPTSDVQKCDAMYGNCVLIPHSVTLKVGNIDTAFIHSLGDLDYALRARNLGCHVWVAPGYIGTCNKNSVRNSWVDTKLPVLERLRKILQIKGFPLKPWTTFCSRHSGPFWIFYWFLPYIRAIIGYKNLATSPTFSEDPKETKPEV